MDQQAEFNLVVWHVFNKIKSCLSHAKPASSARYSIQLIFSNNEQISSQDEFEVFRRLVEWRAIRLIRRELTNQIHVIMHFEIIQPKFDEIYKQFELLYSNISHNTPPQSKNEQSELAFKYENQIQHSDHKQEKSKFSIYYIQREISLLETTLKHCLQISEVTPESFTLITAHIKILRKLFDSDNPTKKKRKTKRHKSIIINKQQPLPITGEIVVTGLTESLKSLEKKSPEYSGPKFPFKIPAGTHWNNVIIKFLDDEQVEIYIKKLKHTTDYKEMGMVGKGKQQTPSEQWLFLRILAKCFGELSFKDSEAKDKYKKQKQVLAENLQNYFSIDYDPFYPYHSSPEKRGNSYKIKLMLLPPPQSTKPPMITDDNDTDPLGIHDFLSEEAPQVIDY